MKMSEGKYIALGAGVGIIFGAALGNIGVGLVIGAAIGYFWAKQVDLKKSSASGGENEKTDA